MWTKPLQPSFKRRLGPVIGCVFLPDEVGQKAHPMSRAKSVAQNSSDVSSRLLNNIPQASLYFNTDSLMLDLISGPWHWSFSGLMIALTMFALLYAGKQFGFSSNLRTMCSIAGAGKRTKFFDFDWKSQRWNLVFALGSVLGGFIAFFLIPNTEPVQLSAETIGYLESIGIGRPGSSTFSSYLPTELFSTGEIFTLRGLVTIVGGGFLIGFGTRWAGGCTSGHAISGLSNLQLPSLIAVIGFFIGGLTMSWLLLPFIVQL
ncbi:MAG: putative membrane protein YedE/YeeE [Neolewinella sp.]